MCVIIEVNCSIVETGAELRRAVGPYNIVLRDCDTIGDDECLCHVDIEATAKKAGMSCYQANDFVWWTLHSVK